MAVPVRQGDTILFTFELKKNSATFIISATSTVEVRFYEDGELFEALGTLLCSNSEDGADWDTSVVTLKLTAEQSSEFVLYDQYEIRVRIIDDDSEVITYTMRELGLIKIVPGF